MAGYRNPVIPGFQPDPSVCRAGDDYVLVTSSFTYFPGVPVFVSKDLVNWNQVGNVLDRVSQLDLTGTDDFPSGGIFAPTIRYHDGRFWMITTVFGGAKGLDNFFVTSTDPAGPWSEPVHLDIFGIDPDLAWDDEGNCWVHCSLGEIFRYRIDDATGEILDGPTTTWSGTGLQFPEAPHLFRRDGWWYLLIAEGGTERGHAVSIARSRAVDGPWESCPANPILSHRSSDRPIQNTGHADLVEAPDGSWWMVLLATRTKGSTPFFHGLGRETFLTPVDWVDDWPVPHDLTLEMPIAPPGAGERIEPVRDDFEEETFAPHWVSVRRPLEEVASLADRRGWLSLSGGEETMDDPRPVFVGRRQTQHRCRVRTLVEIGRAQEAGVCVRMDEHHHYEVAVVGSEVVVRARIGPLGSAVARSAAPAGPVVLRIEFADPEPSFNSGPDAISFGYEHPDGRFESLATFDGRYLSTEVAAGFLGRVIGMYAVSGTARFDWFELTDTDTDTDAATNDG